MFNVGAVVDGLFQVDGLCSSAGGMGTVLFVHALNAQRTRFVLKYCSHSDEEVKNRFRREVRVMQNFNGNPYVAPIEYANLDHSPPFFVMPYFEHGDLTRHTAVLRANPANAEFCFNRMIDCIAQLHSQGIFHRDIKPQNFLVGNGTLVVADLGLCTEQGSATAFTRTSVYGGTPGFIPPEFLNGGFRHADAASDIFMLGVSFLSILADVEAPHAAVGLISPPLLVVIERACSPDRTRRYMSLAALRQSLTFAFDAVLQRVSGSVGVLGAQQAMTDRWKTTGQTDVEEVYLFLDELAMLQPADQQRICMDLPSEVFQAMANVALPVGRLQGFLQSYLSMASNAEYGWSFAEVIANNGKVLFDSPHSSSADKAEALRAAIVASVRQNRFAAMDTCRAMIASVSEPELAQRVIEVMIQHQADFMQRIDPLTCRSGAIRQVIAMFNVSANTTQGNAPHSPFPI